MGGNMQHPMHCRRIYRP